MGERHLSDESLERDDSSDVNSPLLSSELSSKILSEMVLDWFRVDFDIPVPGLLALQKKKIHA